MFRPLDDDYVNPSENMAHFTNRFSEHDDFRRALDLPADEHLPVIMFFGVGGTGKTWLLRHLRQSLPKGLPSSHLDLDPRTGGSSFDIDWARGLAQLRSQFGAGVRCPRFDLAYTWMRFKQCAGNEPLFKASALLGNAWQFLIEVGSAVTSDIPGAKLVTLVIKKVTSPVTGWLKSSGVEDWLATQIGEKDYLRLKAQDAGDVYLELHKRLLQDLRENLPARGPTRCRGVIFLDAIESCRSARYSEEKTLSAQGWIRNLYHPESGVLLVLGGRDRLTWGDIPDTDFADRRHLEQHLIGGLSETAARAFLTNCGILMSALQDAVLRVALDVEEPERSASSHGTNTISHIPDVAYHPFTLGLCADTIANFRRRGENMEPATFDIAPGDIQKLAERFLRSFGEDAAYSLWLKKLALAVRFDERAGREAFTLHAGAEQDAGWRTLLSYSFVNIADEPGWWTLHAKMRRALEAIQASEHLATNQAWWRNHWTVRSTVDTDDLAALAWFHRWRIDPVSALRAWTELAERERKNCRMVAHYQLLSWWDHVDLILELKSLARKQVVGSALNELGIELQKATGGSRSNNLRYAIHCHQSALHVFGEADFPQNWAGIRINLGNAYRDLTTGDRGKNLTNAIDCYRTSLRILTEVAFPQVWAKAQNNLGNAYQALPTGDRGENIGNAIQCYQFALRVYSETDFPEDWAMTQNNLGTAYQELPTGARGENLAKAIECCEAALRVRTEAALPQAWATTQHNLGTAYQELLTGDHDLNLAKAIDCYKLALRVRTEAEFPQDWATTQNNLGNAHRKLTRDREKNIAKAMDCYQAALRVRTKEGFPLDWAVTQNNLGIAYSILRTGDHGSNVAKAIEHFCAAECVWTEQEFPQDWAKTQNNLGNVYLGMPTGDRGENLAKAIDCLQGAMRVRNEADFCHDFASTIANLGMAWWVIAREWDDQWQCYGWSFAGSSQRATKCLNEAVRVFRTVGDAHNLEKHEHLLRQIEKDMTTG